LHLLAKTGIERREWFVKEKELRTIHQGAGEGYALLLAAAEARWPGAAEFRHFHHVQGVFDAARDFISWSALHTQAIRDVFSHVQVRE
jgi:hypothetical protein